MTNVAMKGATAPDADLILPTPMLASIIEHIPIGAIKPYERNPRIHKEEHIAQLAGLIRRVGFLIPILVDGRSVIIAGHGRHLAAQKLGLATVPIIRVEHLTPAQADAFRIGDNKIAERSTWEEETLAFELKQLLVATLEDPELIDLTVFEQGEFDAAIEVLDEDQTSDPADEPMEPDAGPATTKLGDLIRLGRHRLLCGSALEEESFRTLMGETRARTVASDPPFNRKISGHVSGLGKIRHREFAMASGEMSEDEFTSFLTRYLECAKAYSLPGALCYGFIDGAHLFELLTAARRAGLSFKTLCTWGKTAAGMGSFYRQQTEHCPVFKNGGDDVPHVNNIQLGRLGRHRTTLWTYPGCNTFGKGRMDDLRGHPTPKNLAMIADLIKDSSRAGEAILDPFCGSGTTILAAERTGRIGYGIELDPIYCDLIIRRFEKLTGQKAIYEATGLGAAETRDLRLGAHAATSGASEDPSNPANEAARDAEVDHV